MENIFDKLSGKTFILNRIANRKNTTVEEVHKMYRDRFTPDATLLTHYKMAYLEPSKLDKGYSVYPYLERKESQTEIERGRTIAETLFEFGALKLQGQLPTTVIKNIYYRGRNDSGIECSFLLPSFYQVVASLNSILIVYPSPDMLLCWEKLLQNSSIRSYFLVTDDCVKQLYEKQFSTFRFETFDRVKELGLFDSILFTGRTGENLYHIIPELLIHTSGNLYAFLASSFMKDKNFWREIGEREYYLSGICSIPSEAFESKPRKKIFMELRKKNSEKEVDPIHFEATYQKGTRELKFEHQRTVSAELFDRAAFTLKQIQNISTAKETTDTRSISSFYRYSAEISLCVTVKEKNGFYVGNAYYGKIPRDAKRLTRTKLSPDTQKGMRLKKREELKKEELIQIFQPALEEALFSDRIDYFVVQDIEDFY